jgi:hypothetical protein
MVDTQQPAGGFDYNMQQQLAAKHGSHGGGAGPVFDILPSFAGVHLTDTDGDLFNAGKANSGLSKPESFLDYLSPKSNGLLAKIFHALFGNWKESHNQEHMTGGIQHSHVDSSSEASGSGSGGGSAAAGNHHFDSLLEGVSLAKIDASTHQFVHETHVDRVENRSSANDTGLSF